MKSLEEYLSTIKEEVNARLASAYPPDAEPTEFENSYNAMRYMLFLGGGGKRFRSALAVLAAESCGGTASRAWTFAQAVEELHTYTLILDDIQDDSSLRRHHDTCHVLFGVNTALLAAMRIYERGLAPFHMLAPSDVARARKLLDSLHRGQAADLQAENWEAQKRSVAGLQFIHSGKTSALMQLALLGGAVAAEASDQQKTALLDYGYFLGLAFQAKDDILSVTSSEEVIGKPSGTQADEHKLTYPQLFGSVAEASAQAAAVARQATACLSSFNSPESAMLREIAFYSVSRSR